MELDRACSLLLTLALLGLPVTTRAADETTAGQTDSQTDTESAQAADETPPPEGWQPAGEVSPPAPTAAAEQRPLVPSPIFSLGEFALDVHGRLQALGGLVGDDANVNSGDELSRDGFRIRRARLGLDGQLTKQWQYAIELDLVDEYNGGNVLLDAWAAWTPWSWLWIRAGAGKPGFSRADLVSSGDLQFMERPVWVSLERATDTQMLSLDRQVGLAAGGRISLFFYEVGVYNGSRSISMGDWNDGLLYTVRLGLALGELGPSEADLSRSSKLRLALGFNGYLNQDAAAEYRGAGVDLGLKWNGLSFYAEALWAKGIPNEASEDVVSLLDQTERWAMSAQAGYLLPFDFLDLELAVRFSIMDDQVHVEDEGDLWALTAGLNAYFYDNFLKLMINYVHREERHGADLSNDLLAAMLQLKF